MGWAGLILVVVIVGLVGLLLALVLTCCPLPDPGGNPVA